MSTTTKTRRAYGNVRQLPSGRWGARYTGPDGRRRTIGAYATKSEAEATLAGVLSDVYRGTYHAPERGARALSDYARRWLLRQHELAPRTRELYGRLLERWLLAPHPLPGARARVIDLGAYELRTLTPTVVAEWHAAVLEAAGASATARALRAAGASDVEHARLWARAAGLHVAPTGRLPRAALEAWQAAGSPSAAAGEPPAPGAGRTQAAQAYRLLRTICSAAVRDKLIDANPCQVPRAGQVRAAERVPASPEQVAVIAAAMPERYRAAVVVAAWSGLRAGELFALQRRHIDVTRTGAVRLRVEQALVELTGQPTTYGPPKSEAGRRTVHLPPAAGAALLAHLERYGVHGSRQLVFATEAGRPLRGGARTQMFARARAVVGRDDLRWHDLRHTGAVRAAEAGATLAELQRRLGHSTVAAALIYQHASDESDQRLADRMAALEAAHAAPNVVPLRA